MSWSRSVASAPARHSLRLAVSAALLATPAWSAQLPTLVKDINQISYGDLGSGPLAHAHPLTRGGHPHAPPYVKVGGRFYFSAATLPNGRELYVSDGTANGTRMVKDIFPGRGDSFRSSPSHFERSSLMAVGSRVFFMANDGTHGYELWVSDGTLSGTRMIRDIQPGTGSSFPTLGGALAGKLYFSADNGVNGAELWVSDGTTRGTVMLRDIGPKQSSSGPGNFTVFRTRLGRKLYFAATGSNGRELWVTDGTPKGTFELRNIGPGSLSSNPTYFLQIGSRLFFQARGASSLPSLWVTDGSALGTREVRPQTFVYPTYFVALNGKLIFSAMGANGAELWISDGTANGTFELKDIRAGRAGSLPRHMTALGSQVFFTANDGLKGTELWVTDGTPQGTVLAADIND
ncbi:MAG: ELWxxDGT repeat protein, partial [Planctomycetota bacterium]